MHKEATNPKNYVPEGVPPCFTPVILHLVTRPKHAFSFSRIPRGMKRHLPSPQLGVNTLSLRIAPLVSLDASWWVGSLAYGEFTTRESIRQEGAHAH